MYLRDIIADLPVFPPWAKGFAKILDSGVIDIRQHRRNRHRFDAVAAYVTADSDFATADDDGSISPLSTTDRARLVRWVLVRKGYDVARPIPLGAGSHRWRLDEPALVAVLAVTSPFLKRRVEQARLVRALDGRKSAFGALPTTHEEFDLRARLYEQCCQVNRPIEARPWFGPLGRHRSGDQVAS